MIIVSIGKQASFNIISIYTQVIARIILQKIRYRPIRIFLAGVSYNRVIQVTVTVSA